jgi:hypothetical protein
MGVAQGSGAENILTSVVEFPILRTNLSGIEATVASSRFVEIIRDALVVHE